MSIVTEHLSHIYSPDSPFEVKALDDVSLTIGDGEFVALIGPTGSGKSTLVQHLNGLIKPQTGRVLVDGLELFTRAVSLKQVRRKVGLVFQYPEYQLFEETVLADVMFGPKNVGATKEEAEQLAREALAAVGVDAGILARSPFELSGGQMRRVAIAGVLAMGPTTLVLDEPTAGLDPRGRDDLLGHLKRLQTEKGITIVLVSHSMEDVAKVSERVIVIDHGKILMDGPTRQVFSHVKELVQIGLGVPAVTRLMQALKDQGKDVRQDVLSVDEAVREIERVCCHV
jgi:energy-coupling factor transport system ATP-binding protein